MTYNFIVFIFCMFLHNNRTTIHFEITIYTIIMIITITIINSNHRPSGSIIAQLKTPWRHLLLRMTPIKSLIHFGLKVERYVVYIWDWMKWNEMRCCMIKSVKQSVILYLPIDFFLFIDTFFDIFFISLLHTHTHTHTQNRIQLLKMSNTRWMAPTLLLQCLNMVMETFHCYNLLCLTSEKVSPSEC